MKHSKAFRIAGLVFIIIGFWRIWRIDHEHVHAIYRIEQAIGIKKHAKASKKNTTSSSKSTEEDDGPYVATDLQGYWQDDAGDILRITSKHLWTTTKQVPNVASSIDEYDFSYTEYNGEVYVFTSETNPDATIAIDDSQESPYLYSRGYNSVLVPPTLDNNN